MADWFYFQGGSQKGPVSDDQLRGMVAAGQLSPGDSVWKQGMANWTPISSVPELAGAPTAPPMMAPASPPMGGPAPAYDDYGGDRAPTTGGGGGVKKISLWSILIVSGAGLWLINAFMPWWGISFKDPRDAEQTKENQEAWKKATEIVKENSEWYVSNLGTHSAKLRKVLSDPEASKVSVTLLGIGTGTGLFAFILAILILGAVITSFFVQILADWRWTGAFAFALFGLIFLIMGIIWLFGPPGADSPPFLSQGNSIGPILHLPATLLVLVGSILEGLFGLFAFLARMKKSPS